MKKGSSSKKKRPAFRKPKAKAGAETPEKLFYGLQGREKSHGYLRGPQQDVLRDYEKISDATDIAFELPTGTPQTSIGHFQNGSTMRVPEGAISQGATIYQYPVPTYRVYKKAPNFRGTWRLFPRWA